MNTAKNILGKVLYGGIFVVVLPILLWIWSYFTEDVVNLPAIQSTPWGIGMLVVGGGLVIWGMIALMIYGNGLPMNAFPPKRLVRKGPFAFLDHPIYTGFGIVLIGVSVLIGSASALWIVTPLGILSMLALVWGFERIDLKERFPDYSSSGLLSLPGKMEKKLPFGKRVTALLIPVILWIVANNMVWLLFGVDQSIEDLNDFIFLQDYYGIPTSLCLLFILFIPFLPLSASGFREWILSVILAAGLITFTAVVWPVIGAQYFYRGKIYPGLDEISLFGFPLFIFFSFHTSWMLFITKIFSQAFYRWRIIIWSIGLVLFLLMCINTLSPILSLVIGVLIFWIITERWFIWLRLRRISERIANSWKEWVFGPVRIINHGFYVGFGAFLGILMAGWLVGSDTVWGLVIFGIVVVVFSALWAQLIEGSEKLKRPYGYYGALVGIVFASIIIWTLNYDVWVIIGIISVFMPWVQAIGRLRCLVNGCCHGKPVFRSGIGIRYYHSRSRVCGISNLKGIALHPTPLYAIVWLFFIGLFLLALWLRGMSYSFIFGMYLILTGIGRFVEEAYRGEVQTKILYKLRLYQWTAITSVVIGAIFTCINIPRSEIVVVHDFSVLYAALVLGLFTFFAMGVDFPKSNRRFSRLV